MANASVNPYRIDSYAKQNTRKGKRARRVLKTLDDYNGFLTTSVIGNNIINSLLAFVLSLYFETLLPIWAAILISFLIVDISVVIFSELIPKVLGRKYSNELSLFYSGFIRFWYIVFYPLSYFFKKTVPQSDWRHQYTRKEINILIENSLKEKEINEDEVKLFKNSMKLLDKKVGSFLEKEKNVKYISQKNLSLENIKLFLEKTMYSYAPILNEEKEFIMLVDVINSLLKNKIVTMHKYSTVSEKTKVTNLIDNINKNTKHIFLIWSNGKITGLLTSEDIVEQLIGPIIDEAKN